MILFALALFTIFVISFLFYKFNEEIQKFIIRNEKILLSILFALPVFFLLNVFIQEKWIEENIDFFFDLNGHFNIPYYLSFFATAITAYYLYKTLVNQRTANQKQAFENRFFKFIDYHRQNVDELKYRDPKSKEEKYWVGNSVFTIIHYEIKELLEEYTKTFSLKNKNATEKRKVIDFIYQCVFYGAGKEGMRVIKLYFSDNELNKIDFQNRLAAYSSDNDDEKKYYSGHVRRLGHYFRNFYQAVKYVDSQPFLKPDDKYEYLKIYRAQMSYYEQSIFFFNSLSEVGKSWEYEFYDRFSPKSQDDKQKFFNRLLITKYDLLRNMMNPDGFLFNDVSIKEFYPLIHIERDFECKISGALPFKDNPINICRFCFNEKYIRNDDGDNKSKEIILLSELREEEIQCDEEKCATRIALKNAIE